jgi:Flp pilus assembly protein CpaB
MTIKKIIPIIAAIFVAFLAISLLGAREAEKTEVVVLNRNLPPGHTIIEADVTLSEMPVANLPADVISDPAQTLGSVLRVSRSEGDFLAASHLGGDVLELASDERAVTIEVSDSAGLAGQLKPGDFIGVTAILTENDFTYAKVAAEGLKVLSISPEFQAIDPAAYKQGYAQDEDSFGAVEAAPDRSPKGTITLAVPVDAVVVAYDFFAYGAEDEYLLVNVIELLQALDQDNRVAFSLYLMPDDALAFKTAGIFLQNLIVTPGPTPTPTPTPFGWIPEQENTPEPTVTP